MKKAVFAALVSAATVALPLAASAADAMHPYSNIDHRIDAGNNTGNWLVPKLNAQQLQLNGIDARLAIRSDSAWDQATRASVQSRRS